MISLWLDAQPERFREILDPSWSPVRAAVVLASRNEQAALADLDAFVRADRERTVEAMATTYERLSVALGAIWPEGVPENMASACPCQSELEDPGPRHFADCPYRDEATSPFGFEIPEVEFHEEDSAC